MNGIVYPKNYESWPTMWKSCFMDGVIAGRNSCDEKECNHEYEHISTTAFIGYICKKCGHKI